MIDLTNDYYVADFIFANCDFEVYVNQIPVLRNMTGGQIGTSMIVNQMIEPGPNTFSVNIIPHGKNGFDLTSVCIFKILHKRGEEVKTLAEAKFAYNDEQPVPLGNLSGGFVVNSTLIRESIWHKNPEQDLNDQQKADLHAAFARLLGLFRKKDIDAIMVQAKLKDNHFIERYFIDKQERLEFIRNYFLNIFNNDQWKLATYFDNQYGLRPYANNKLYSFELFNLNSPLELRDDIDKWKVNVPVFFAFLDGKPTWVL